MAEQLAAPAPPRSAVFPTRQAAYAGLRVLVAGLGVSGRAAARRLAELGAEVLAIDDALASSQLPDGQRMPSPQRLGALDELGRLGVRLTADDDPGRLLAGRDVVVPAPGLRPAHPLLVAAAAAGVPVRSEIELGAALATMPLVGVTGTNGKTTTTELAVAMLRADGMAAVGAGNLGLPLTDAVRQEPAPDAVVVELSSFQLHFTWNLRLRAAAWLNLAPDHLDWHPDLAGYTADKARIFTAVGSGDWTLYPAADPLIAGAARAAAGRPVPLSTGPPPDGGIGTEAGVVVSRVPETEGALWRVAALRLPGEHNLGNAVAASGLALALGAQPEAMARAVAGYEPAAHRMVEVATADGIRFVDDSKATNPHAAARSVAACAPVVWLAGGRNKGLDLGGVASAVAPHIVAAVLLGEAADELRAALAAAGFPGPMVRAASMGEAVLLGFSLAEPGDTVLLAPACASFDMYADYRARGEAFAAAARDLAAAASARRSPDARPPNRRRTAPQGGRRARG